MKSFSITSKNHRLIFSISPNDSDKSLGIAIRRLFKEVENSEASLNYKKALHKRDIKDIKKGKNKFAQNNFGLSEESQKSLLFAIAYNLKNKGINEEEIIGVVKLGMSKE